jgi:mRNA interferase YafQ
VRRIAQRKQFQNDLRECHIEPDWLLIYDITDAEVVLLRTGTHSDLFE